jgi:diguanylate cyclase (GGDEF)-like protein
MATPVDLSSDLSRRLISLLEGRRNGIDGWKKKISRLEQEHGTEVYRNFLYVLTHLDFPARKAKSHWVKLLGEWEKLSRKAGPILDLRVAALHYFLQKQKELKNPTVVEIKFLQKTQGSAIKDGLTRVYNYRYFRDRIEQEVMRVHRYGRGLSLLMVDVDDFKVFNDRNGHLAGNTALKKLARLFKRAVRDVDVVCRYGGEEFAIILPATLKRGALTAAEKIRGKVEKTAVPGEERQPGKRLTVSIGVATVPSDASSSEELVARADAALYRAKAEGKNRVAAFSDERREFVRYDAELKGSLRALDELAAPLQTVNISQGGFRFTTRQSYSVGSVLQLDLSIPRQKKEVSCTVRVVRGVERKQDFEIGAEIIHLGSEDLYRFRRYIAAVSKKAATGTAVGAKQSSQRPTFAKASTFAKATAWHAGD